MRSGGQVNPDSSGLERQKHDGGAVGCRALELLDDLSSFLLGHGAVQTHEAETVLSGRDEGGTTMSNEMKLFSLC